MSDLAKILAPIPAMVRHQTDAACCVVLLRDSEGECHIVAEGSSWSALVVACAGRVLDRAQVKQQEEKPND